MKTNIKEVISKYLPSVLLIILGIAFIIFSNSITTYIVTILGIYLIIVGANKLYQDHIYSKESYLYSLPGVTILILGILTVIFSSSLAAIFLSLIGVYVLCSGIISSINDYKSLNNNKENIIKLIFGIIETIIGIILVFKPGSTLSFINIIIGIYLIYKGIILIINKRYFKTTSSFSFIFKSKSSKKQTKETKKDPNIIDHDEITDDDILKK